MAFDGSLLEVRGSEGWILSIRTGKLSFEEMAKGGSSSRLQPRRKSLTWCDLNGILVCLSAIEQVTNGQAKGQITAGCDSSAALAGFNILLSKRFSTCLMQAGSNADLLREIRAFSRKLPRLHFKWVKVEAHLDKDPHTPNED